MGLFTTPPSQTSSPPPPPAPTPSPDGAFEAPNRDRRAQCWQARDAFFACLDKHNIIDSIKDKEGAERSCGEEGKGLERECASSWVTYFKQRRVMEFNKKQTLERLKAEGAKGVPEGVAPPGLQRKPS